MAKFNVKAIAEMKEVFNKAQYIKREWKTDEDCTMKNGKPEVVKDDGGKATIPSIVSFVKNDLTGEIGKIVGAQAHQQMLTNAENTVYCIKRLIGHDFKSASISHILPTLPYKVIPGQQGNGLEIYIPALGKNFSTEEISSYILTELRSTAEKYVGETITKAVITVPAYFNNKQRQATKDAAAIAGIDVMRIINEPTAAALAYGFSKSFSEEKLLAVFDFGGGTFDITLMEVSKDTFNVVATAGNTFLGGEDIKNALLDYLLDDLATRYNLPDIDDQLVIQRLRDYAETAKKNLTIQTSVSIEIPYLKEVNGSFIHYKTEVTRDKLEELALPFIQKAIITFDKTLQEVQLTPDALAGIILIGGQTRMPLIQSELANFCPNVQILKNINPDETVAIGAALQAKLLEEESNGEDNGMLLLDVTPHNLGIAVGKDMFYTLIQKNSTVPTSVDDIFVTSHDNQEKAKILLLQGGRILVDFERVVFLVFLLGADAAVHVNHVQGFRVFDHEIGPRLDRYDLAEGAFDLAAHFKVVENRFVTLIELDDLLLLGRYHRHIIVDFLIDSLVVDVDIGKGVVQQVAQDGRSPAVLREEQLYALVFGQFGP